MVPIGYKLAKESTRKILFLSINPLYDISTDFRLNYLKNEFNIHTDYLYSYYCDNGLQRLFGRLIKNRYFQQSSKDRLGSFLGRKRGNNRAGANQDDRMGHLLGYTVAGVFKKYFFGPFYDKLIRRYVYNRKWASSMLESCKPTCLVFDHAIRPGLHVVDDLLFEAKRRKIPVITVPHGVLLFDKNHEYVRKGYANPCRKEASVICVSHDRWKEGFVASGVPCEKVRVMGSPRYCAEWTEVLHRIVPDNDLKTEADTNKLKVVYMERQADRHGEYKREVQETLIRISQMPFMRLIIQPSTRAKKLHFETQGISCEIAKDASSVNLCNWADVIICLSSIMIEVLLQDKVFIDAKYLHGHSLLYDDYDVGWMVNNYEELEEALKKLRKEPAHRPYLEKNVRRFLNDVVYGGVEGRDVLDDYKNCVLEIAREYK